MCYRFVLGATLLNSRFLNLVGDLERKFDLEISPLCDQQADSVPDIQTGKYQAANIHSTTIYKDY